MELLIFEGNHRLKTNKNGFSSNHYETVVFESITFLKKGRKCSGGNPSRFGSE